MRRTLIIAAALAAVPVMAHQAPPSPPGAPQVSRISGGTYTVDPAHSLVEWTVDHMGFTPYTGLFGDVEGTLELDPAHPSAARVEVTIPIAKVTTASQGLTQHLLRAAKAGGKPDFFGADPQAARFVSRTVTPTGAQSAMILGDLTLNGVTKPVELAARFYGAGQAPEQMGGKENVGFTATGKMKRSDWGIGFGVPIVSDEVALEIVAAFQK